MSNPPLLSDLQTFNTDLRDSVDPTTRSWGGFGRICALVGADALGGWEGAKMGGAIGAVLGPKGVIVGGSIGGIVCGVGASYLAYDQVYPRMVACPSEAIYDKPAMLYQAALAINDRELAAIKKDANVKIGIPSEFIQSEKIAIQHNAILINLAEGNLPPETALCDDVYYDAISSPEFTAQFQGMADDVLASMRDFGQIDIDTYFNHVDPATYNPVTKMILELFLEIYTYYPQKMEDIDFVVNHYIQKISASKELTNQDKEALLTGLAVAAYSPRLWSDYIDN